MITETILQRRKLMKYTVDYVFCALTRAIMTMLCCGGIYLLRTILRIRFCPASALTLYHSVPDLAEHLTAGILVYAAFSLLFVWTASHNTV
jgi:hypothetical protein